MGKKITPKEHRARHVLLHKMLDELVADMIVHTGRVPSNTTVFQLMFWSSRQTTAPAEGVV